MQEDASFDVAVAKTNELHPKILVKGNIQDCNDMPVVAEDGNLHPPKNVLVDALLVYMATNYVLCSNILLHLTTYVYFFKNVLHIHGGKKLPSSILEYKQT